MESLTLCLSSSSLSLKPHHQITHKSPQIPLQNPLFISSKLHQNHASSNLIQSITTKTSLKPRISLPILLGFLSYSSPLSSLASEISDPSSQIPERINLESIVVSIDGFFNKYPYFVAGVTFIWLIVIPLLEEYLNKYQPISALDAFKKLRDDSSVQLLDIRDDKSVAFIGSPNLRFLNKDVVQVPFNEADEDGFLKRVQEKFADPNNTIVCILDSFDGNSMKVAELLFKNGFKETYGIKGGVRGNKGWKDIQLEFLPPAVHVFPKKKGKKLLQREENGAAIQPDSEQVPAAASEK